MTRSQLHTHLLFKYNGNDTRLCTNVDVGWIYETVLCWIRTDREYVVRIGVCLNLNVSLLGIRYVMKPSQLYTRLPSTQIHYNDIDLWLCGDVGWTYQTVYRVGFGRTESTLVFGHVWIRMCHCLVYAAPWHDHNWTLDCYSTTMAIAHRSALVLMLLECMERNGKWLRADVDWMYATVYRVAFGRVVGTSVNIGAYLNWNVSLFGVRCTTTPSRLHTRLLLNYNGNDTRLCADVDWIYGTVSYWLLTNRKYVGTWACLNLNMSLLGIPCNIGVPISHHHNYTFDCHSNTLRWQ